MRPGWLNANDHWGRSNNWKTSWKFSCRKSKSHQSTLPSHWSTIEQRFCCKTNQRNWTTNLRCMRRSGAKTKERRIFSCRHKRRREITSLSLRKNCGLRECRRALSRMWSVRYLKPPLRMRGTMSQMMRRWKTAALKHTSLCWANWSFWRKWQ